MIFGDTPLHCDPHGGNIAIRKNNGGRRPNFDIILYDHGLYRDIPKQLRRDYAKLWLAVIGADEIGMRKYAYDVAGITDDQFPLFASAITGRDYMTATRSVVSTRSDQEKEEISDAMGEGMLQEVISPKTSLKWIMNFITDRRKLVQLLGKVPRIILLILKTNDLSMCFWNSSNLLNLLTRWSPQPRREPAHSRRSGAQLHDFSSLLQQDGVARANGNHWPDRQYLVAVQFLPALGRLGVFYEGPSQALYVWILHYFPAFGTPSTDRRHLAWCPWSWNGTLLLHVILFLITIINFQAILERVTIGAAFACMMPQCWGNASLSILNSLTNQLITYLTWLWYC